MLVPNIETILLAPKYIHIYYYYYYFNTLQVQSVRTKVGMELEILRN